MPLPLSVRIVGDFIEITQSKLKICQRIRISEANLSEIGSTVLTSLIHCLNAHKPAPRAQKITSLPRLSISPHFWTVEEFAALHQISEATVRRYCVKGLLDARKVACRWRITGKPVADCT